MTANSSKPLSFGDFYAIVWNLVPSVWRNNDSDYGKSLQIVLYTMSQHMYFYFYNRIVHMDELFDPDLCPEKYLKFLSGMVGWTLQGTDPISWREQIKAAPLLYKIRGTKRGLLLAEKLVGYSVFMSELYRDHIGDIVPKEKIFNNTPDSVKIKPWFRKTLTSIEGESLPGAAESDQFDSYNRTGLVKLNSFGKVLRPRVISNTRKLLFNPLSTTSRYNNITGQYSLARYAKLPRINVVLKYDHDLDAENLDGSIKDNNFSSALDLLMRFKPFHVLIQGLEVRYDISEFIFDQTAINSDVFNMQESFDSAVSVTMDRTENTIAYGATVGAENVTEYPADSSDNRGVISSVYQVFDLAKLTPTKETSLFSTFKKSLPIKTFPFVSDISSILNLYTNAASTDKNLLSASGDRLLTKDDFVSSISTPMIFASADNSISLSFGIFDARNYAPGTIITVINTLYNNGTFTISSASGGKLLVEESIVDEYSVTNTLSVDLISMNPSPGKNDTYIIPTDEIEGRVAKIQADIIYKSLLNKKSIYYVPANDIEGRVPKNRVDIMRDPGHTVIQYSLRNLLSNPVLDFKTMLCSQKEVISFAEQTTADQDTDGNGVFSNKIISTNYMGGVDSSCITNVSIPNNSQPYRSSITTSFGSSGGIATFLDNIMTLVSPPAVGSIASGQTITGTGLPENLIMLYLLSGKINEASSKYYLSKPAPGSNITITTTDIQSLLESTVLNPDSTMSRPWDLQEIKEFAAGPANGFLLASGITELSDQYTYIFKQHLYDNSTMVVFESGGDYLTLTAGLDYYFDNSDIFLNTASIASALSISPKTYNFLLAGKLHLLYLSRTTHYDQTENGIPGRGFRYTTRINNKFSRQFAVNTTKEFPLSSVMPTPIVSVNSKTKAKTVLGNKSFRKSSNIYNRSSLKNEFVDGYNIVSRDPLNRTDKSKWTIYSPEYTAYYLGDQTIANNWWGNYYEVKVSKEAPYYGIVPYEVADTSEAGQLNHSSSDQWLFALQAYNPNDPKHFLVSRPVNSNRASIWNRSSCKFASVPFIQSRRDSLQPFRKDVTTFTRAEESSDYPADTSAPIRVDNYKYVLSDGTDVSLSWFSPDFSSTLETFVSIESAIGQKALLTSSGYNLSTSGSGIYYDDSVSGSAPEVYFENITGDYNIKSSLYAGNIPINFKQTVYSGISERLDKLSILIPGAIPVTDRFTVSNGSIYTYTLSNPDLWIEWQEINTGENVGFWHYSLSPSESNISPNIKLFLNGTLLRYGFDWVVESGIIKSVTILPEVSLEALDIIVVEYKAMSLGQTEKNTEPLDLVYHTITSTITGPKTTLGTDLYTINLGNRFIKNLPATGTIPCVCWYNDDTSAYINSSSDPRAYQPLAMFEIATPNVTVSLNSVIVNYKTGWTFLTRKVSGSNVAAIALSADLSLSLVEGDTVLIEYFSKT